MTPYLVESVTDENGNTIYQHESECRRVVISEETANTVSAILAGGVAGDGGAKNAYVAGYRVAAKTGT
jgi:stage V sporulation protein D (sporulation-specific penicillin-binding protein)